MRVLVVSLMFIGFLTQGISSAQAGFEEFCNNFRGFISAKPKILSEWELNALKVEFNRNPQRVFDAIGHLTLEPKLELTLHQLSDVQDQFKLQSDNPWVVDKLGSFYGAFRSKEITTRNEKLHNEFNASGTKGDPVALVLLLKMHAENFSINPSEQKYFTTGGCTN